MIYSQWYYLPLFTCLSCLDPSVFLNIPFPFLVRWMNLTTSGTRVNQSTLLLQGVVLTQTQCIVFNKIASNHPIGKNSRTLMATQRHVSWTVGFWCSSFSFCIGLWVTLNSSHFTRKWTNYVYRLCLLTKTLYLENKVNVLP